MKSTPGNCVHHATSAPAAIPAMEECPIASGFIVMPAIDPWSICMPGMDPFEITVDGLLLRAWRSGDAEAVYRACQDPDIQRWTTVPRPYELHHAVEFVTDHTDQAWSKGSSPASRKAGTTSVEPR